MGSKLVSRRRGGHFAFDPYHRREFARQGGTCVYVCVCVRESVCVRERERERERVKKEGEEGGGGEGERGGGIDVVF